MNSLVESKKEIIDFLGKTHPSLLEGNSQCIEIRPITRNDYNFNLSKSLNLWNLNDKSTKRIDNFLELHNETPYCLYYSVFTFNYDKPVSTKAGKPAKKGRITAEGAEYTEEIALDFDGVSEEEFFKLKNDFEKTHLKPIWVFTGHGYHCHILLNEKVRDKELLKKAVYLFRSKGFNCDTACIDPARVMRLPFTYNYKGYKVGKQPILARIIEDTDERYSIEEVFHIVGMLPTKNKDAENYLLQQEINFDNRNDTAIEKLVYPYINMEDLPEPVCKILTHCPEGYRNSAFGFLIKFFKGTMKLTMYQIEEILTLWSTYACTPSMSIKKDFRRLYNSGGFTYSPDLTAKYGYIDFSEHLSIQAKRHILIPNHIFNKANKIDGKVLKLYFALKALQHIEKPTTVEEIADFLKISEITVRRILPTAIKTGLVYSEITNKKNGSVYLYYPSKFYSVKEGYSKYSFSDINLFVRELNTNEFKLYLYLCYKCFKTQTCFTRQETIAEGIGVDRTTANKILKQLTSKYYLKTEKIQLTKNVSYCKYLLIK